MGGRPDGVNGWRFRLNGLEIDPAIFVQPFVPQCDIALCGGECCNSGVWADVAERANILAHNALIAGAMDETQQRNSASWFETEIASDRDFDSGKCVGTAVHNQRCVFQMQNGFCVLQTAAAGAGMHRWALKPKFCIIYPLVISNGVLTYDDEHAADMHYCGLDCHRNHTQPVFEACGAEIAFAVGAEGYAILKAHYEANKARYRAECERIRAGAPVPVQIAIPEWSATHE